MPPPVVTPVRFAVPLATFCGVPMATALLWRAPTLNWTQAEQSGLTLAEPEVTVAVSVIVVPIGWLWFGTFTVGVRFVSVTVAAALVTAFKFPFVASPLNAATMEYAVPAAGSSSASPVETVILAVPPAEIDVSVARRFVADTLSL